MNLKKLIKLETHRILLDIIFEVKKKQNIIIHNKFKLANFINLNKNKNKINLLDKLEMLVIILFQDYKNSSNNINNIKKKKM